MQKLLALTLVLGLALTACGFAVATADDDRQAKYEDVPTAVRYDWTGEMGELNLLTKADRLFIVHDSVGMPIFHGVTQRTFTRLPMPNSDFGPEGWILRIDFPEEGVSLDVTDPNWEWN